MTTSFILNNGVEIPAVGLGVFQSSAEGPEPDTRRIDESHLVISEA